MTLFLSTSLMAAGSDSGGLHLVFSKSPFHGGIANTGRAGLCTVFSA